MAESVINQRIKIFIDSSGLSLTKFAELTTIPYRTLYGIVNEGVTPSFEAITKILKAYREKLNASWLLLDDGPMLKERETPEQLKEQLNQVNEELVKYKTGFKEKSEKVEELQQKIIKIYEDREKKN